MARLTADTLGIDQELGSRATLLQISSAFCAPCRATRGLLEHVVATTDGVRHVEIDVADDTDLAARLAITSTPTLFLIGADGAVLARHVGVPRLAAVRELLDELAAATP